MDRIREAIAQNLAERRWWQVVRRDDMRVARRLYRQQVVDGVDRLDDCFHFLRATEVMAMLEQVHGTVVLFM